MYTMNRGLEEVAAGYAGNTAFAAGGRAVALPGHSGTGNNSFIIIIVIIAVLFACSGGLGNDQCCNGKRRRGRRIGNSAILLLIIGVLLAGNGGGGRNLNTNVINVNAQADDGYDGDDGGFLDI